MPRCECPPPCSAWNSPGHSRAGQRAHLPGSRSFPVLCPCSDRCPGGHFRKMSLHIIPCLSVRHPHFTYEETEVQDGDVSSVRSLGLQEARLGFEFEPAPRSPRPTPPGCRVGAPTPLPSGELQPGFSGQAVTLHRVLQGTGMAAARCRGSRYSSGSIWGPGLECLGLLGGRPCSRAGGWPDALRGSQRWG